MQRLQDDYLAAYRSLKLTRDSKGVLVAEFHSNDGPFTFTAQDHTDFVDAFYRIAQDRANKIVILTGAGGDFIPEIDFSSFGNVADPGVWDQVHHEGVQLLENIANIRVPVIAAIEGRAHVHSEYALLANVIVAAEGATFHDVPHFAGGIVPGDGIFTTWSYRAGAGRAEAFLLNPQPLPPSLLIENASDRDPARPQNLPEAFPIKASDHLLGGCRCRGWECTRETSSIVIVWLASGLPSVSRQFPIGI